MLRYCALLLVITYELLKYRMIHEWCHMGIVDFFVLNKKIECCRASVQ